LALSGLDSLTMAADGQQARSAVAAELVFGGVLRSALAAFRRQLSSDQHLCRTRLTMIERTFTRWYRPDAQKVRRLDCQAAAPLSRLASSSAMLCRGRYLSKPRRQNA
jgi:hypothetical protein